jgi:hypothetical protein
VSLATGGADSSRAGSKEAAALKAQAMANGFELAPKWAMKNLEEFKWNLMRI